MFNNVEQKIFFAKRCNKLDRHLVKWSEWMNEELKRMKKKMIMFTVVVSILILAACQGKESNTSEKTLEEIFDATKNEIAEALKADGVDEPLMDGKLSSYFETNLVDEEDEQSELYLERLGIEKDQLAGGYVIAAMMNVNSNEIIILEAKEKSEVSSLEKALEKELAAQTQTWEVYLPDQHEKVKNNIITTSGNYLMYITYDEPEKLQAIFDEKTK